MRHAKLKGEEGGRDGRCMCYISVLEPTFLLEGFVDQKVKHYQRTNLFNN